MLVELNPIQISADNVPLFGCVKLTFQERSEEKERMSIKTS